MKILIINLPTSSDRRKFQEEQMQKLNLEYEILDAMSINDIDNSEYKELSMGWERPLRKSEVACFLSHKKAWNFVLTENEPILILEDDALLSYKVPSLLQELSTRDDCHLVTMEIRARKKLVGKKSIQLLDKVNLLNLYQDRTGAAGYILWPKGAKILLDKATKTSPGLADAFISSTYQLNSFQVEPAPIIQLDMQEYYQIITPTTKTSSAISSEKKPPLLSLSQKLTFKTRRIFSQLKMAYRQLSVILKGERRTIRINKKDFIKDE